MKREDRVERIVSGLHALIGEALYTGLHETVAAYLRIIAAAHA